MKWPTIKEVAAELRFANATIVNMMDPICEVDVRLQVYPNSAWSIHVGDPCYDTDHQGYWGASYLPGVVQGKVQRFNSYDTARALLDEAKDQYYQEVG
jgi:hypothetical protein